MTPILRRLLVAAVAVELAVCGWLVWGRLARPVPALPAAFPDDPLLAGEFAVLAERAENGGAADWMHLGESLLGQGLYGHAERAFEQVVALDPRNVEARFALAFCVERTGRVAEGNALYEKCMEAVDGPTVQPSNKKPFALFNIGRNHLRLGDVSAAEAAFRRNEGFVPAEYQLARILHATGRPREAEAVLQKLLLRVPLALELHQLRARVLDALGRPAETFAAAAMEERSAHLIETSFGTDYVRPFTSRQGLRALFAGYDKQMAAHDAAGVNRAYEAIVAAVGDRRIPERITVLTLQGDRALSAGRNEAVLEFTTKIGALGDGSVGRLALEGAARQRMGESDAARALWERALSMEPVAELHRLLADDSDRRGDAAGRDRHRASQRFREAMAEYRSNKLPAALELLRQAAQFDDADPVIWFHIGEIEYHLGRQESADIAFRRALELKPEYGRARDYLERRPQ